MRTRKRGGKTRVMKFDCNKLKSRVVELYGSQGRFADAIGRTDAYVSNVLRGKSSLTKFEIFAWCFALNIPMEEIGNYFFAQ